MRLTPPAVEPSKLTLDFSTKTQSLSALQSTLYRLIGTAVGTVEQVDERFLCKLEPASKPLRGRPVGRDALKQRFLELLADENLRETIATKTEPQRNVLL